MIMMQNCNYAIKRCLSHCIHRFYNIHPSFGFTNTSIAWIFLVGQNIHHEFFKLKTKEPHLVVILLWLFLAFLLSQAYKSNFLANLVKADFEKSPESFQVILSCHMIVTLFISSAVKLYEIFRMFLT